MDVNVFSKLFLLINKNSKVMNEHEEDFLRFEN